MRPLSADLRCNVFEVRVLLRARAVENFRLEVLR